MEWITEVRENKLVERAQAGDNKAMWELMEAYKPAINHQVSKVERHYRESLDDARQEAYLAFMLMVQNHNPEKGRIYQRVKAELANALREASCLQNSAFHIAPRSQRRFQTILKRAEYDPARGAEIASENGMSKDLFLTIYHSLYGRDELDEYGVSLYGDGMEDADSAMLVERARACLDSDEKVVVDAAYGFTHYEPMSDYEISQGLINKSSSTVGRIRNRALTKMRLEIAAA